MKRFVFVKQLVRCTTAISIQENIIKYASPNTLFYQKNDMIELTPIETMLCTC